MFEFIWLRFEVMWRDEKEIDNEFVTPHIREKRGKFL